MVPSPANGVACVAMTVTPATAPVSAIFARPKSISFAPDFGKNFMGALGPLRFPASAQVIGYALKSSYALPLAVPFAFRITPTSTITIRPIAGTRILSPSKP
jgi:hypothetical protein